MNQDRLNEIKQKLSNYHTKLEKADSISESLQLQRHIDELEKEEKEILSDVII